MKWFALGLATALGFSSIASADCDVDATKVIEQKRFTVRSMTWQKLKEPEPGGAVTGHRVWFRVAQCNKGYVIVNMRPVTCLIKHIWAQGQCDVPEVQQALRDHN